MKKGLIFLLVLGLVIGIWIRRNPSGDRVPTNPETKPIGSSVVRGIKDSPHSEPTPSPPKTAADKISNFQPSIAALRTEIEKNPHAPSKGLIEFSIFLSERLKKSVQSSDRIEKENFFNELHECIASVNEKAPKTVRALCLLYLERFGTQAPEFKDGVRAISEKTESEIQQLAQ